MLKGSPDQEAEPRTKKRWPVVANRHRKAAMDEAQEILNLMNEDFVALLQSDIRDEIDDAFGYIRSNPTKAKNILRVVLARIDTLSRTAELVEKRAEVILTVLETAPADDVEEAA
jgi:hypothetical protein